MDFPAYAGNAVWTQAAPYALAAGGAGLAAAQRYLNRKSIAKNTKYRLQHPVEKHVKQFSGASDINNANATVIHLTAIAQGDTREDRTGKHIGLLGFNIRGNVPRGVDVYLCKVRSGTAPVYADFVAREGGHVVVDKKFDIREVAYIKPMSAQTVHMKYVKRFKRPPKVYYDGTTNADGVNNLWFLVFKNNSGSTQGIQYSVDVWFQP